MEALGIGTIAAITALCLLIGAACKASPMNNKYIPVICGVCGVGLGLLGYFTGMPEFPTADPITAAAIGAASGLAATGTNQIAKQLNK